MQSMKRAIQIVAIAACLSVPPLMVVAVTGCAGNRYERSTGQYIDDQGIIVRVKKALSDNPEYKFGDVKVTSFKGIVQLSGFVVTQDQKDRAADIARGVEGVQRVENNISLKP